VRSLLPLSASDQAWQAVASNSAADVVGGGGGATAQPPSDSTYTGWQPMTYLGTGGPSTKQILSGTRGGKTSG